jgi:hypothetical protein
VSVWALIRDIAVTGTGLALIMMQALSAHPSDTLLAVAMALTVPSVAAHVKTITSGGGGLPSSSPSSPRPGSPESGR